MAFYLSGIVIVKPSYEYSAAYLEMCYDYKNNSDAEYKITTIEEVYRKIESDRNYEIGHLPPNRLQSYSYWFILDSRIVGTSRLRPKLNERFEYVGGNIGYDVSPSYRRKGVGTTILAMTIEKAKDMGMTELLITCDESNIGSSKVIENNNGTLINTIYDETSMKKVKRYKIAIC